MVTALATVGVASTGALAADGRNPVREALPRAEDAYRGPISGQFGNNEDAWGMLRRLEQQLKAQQKTIADQQRALEDQRRELEAVRAEIDRDGARPASRNGAATQRNGRTVRASERQPQSAQVPRPPDFLPPGVGVPTPPQPLDPAPVAPGPVAPGPVAPGPVAPGPVAPGPVAPGPVAPDTAGPGPVPPGPVAPEPTPPGEQAPTTAGPGSTQEDADRARLQTQQQQELLLEAGAILLPPGRLQIEQSLDYTHSSSNRINIGGFTIFEAILIGTIRVDDLKRDIITDSVAARIGIFRRLQAEVRVPFVYRTDNEILGQGTNDQRFREVTGRGLGDIDATVTYQPVIARGIWPNVLTRARMKIPTGTNPFEIGTTTNPTTGETRLTEAATGAGFYAFGAGATAVWRSDPAVFFLSTGYTLNAPRTFSGSELDPGDTIDYSVGVNIALSDRVAINFGFAQSFTFETKQNGINSQGSSSNDARVTLGTSIGITPAMSLLVSAGIGLTQDSPDFSISFSVPYTFDLF